MAPAKAPDDKKLAEALLAGSDGQPRKATGSGASPGLFPGGKAGQPLLERALTLELVEKCAGPPPTGKKKAAATPLIRVTAKGRDWALQQLKPREALEGLHAVFRKQSELLRPAGAEVETIQSQLGVLQHSFEQVQQAIRSASSRREQELAGLGANLRAVLSALERLTADGASVPASAHPPLNVEVESFVRRWQQERHVDCPLPELYHHLCKHSPRLSIGAFHDLLRDLHNNGRVRLGGWSGPLDRLPEPELALFISSKVMYDAHVPSHNQ
jgi:hypothetical protein